MNDFHQIDTEHLKETASRIRSLAHPHRLAIIDLLIKNKCLNVTDIHTALNIEQANASHHLGILREKNIIEGHKFGRAVYYSIKKKEIAKIIDCIS